MKKILLLLCLCLFIEEIASRELDKTFQLLPQPQSIELTSGKESIIGSYPIFCHQTQLPSPYWEICSTNFPVAHEKGNPSGSNSPASMFLLLQKDT